MLLKRCCHWSQRQLWPSKRVRTIGSAKHRRISRYRRRHCRTGRRSRHIHSMRTERRVHLFLELRRAGFRASGRFSSLPRERDEILSKREMQALKSLEIAAYLGNISHRLSRLPHDETIDIAQWMGSRPQSSKGSKGSNVFLQHFVHKNSTAL